MSVNGNPPPTGDGAAASARPPLPSCPFEFWPQQYAAPRVVIPQVNLEPALSDLKDNAPKTGAGLVRQSCGPVMSDQVHRSPIPVRYPVGRHGCLPSSGRAPYGMYRSGLRGSGPGQVGCVSTIPTSRGRDTAHPSPRCPRSWCSLLGWQLLDSAMVPTSVLPQFPQLRTGLLEAPYCPNHPHSSGVCGHHRDTRSHVHRRTRWHLPHNCQG